MIKFDQYTWLVIIEAIDSCSEADPELIEKETGFQLQQFEDFKEKYVNSIQKSMNQDDLPIVVAALEWMLVTKNDSDILQIHKEDGLRLLELLSQKRGEIREAAWSLHSV
ncbi:MAG: hypothetical protein IT410_04075 [Candidatus Doudnabacteria bacterium]|nr:hypothetical protein [Candidatus Doudnabacteria bacterium]